MCSQSLPFYGEQTTRRFSTLRPAECIICLNIYQAPLVCCVLDSKRYKTAVDAPMKGCECGKPKLVSRKVNSNQTLLGGATTSLTGQEDKHPSLRSFLETSNAAALRALGNDVEASTTDPRRWLNPTGHNLLSEIPGFERQNSSMMWGTYRPGVYFGECH